MGMTSLSQVHRHVKLLPTCALKYSKAALLSIQIANYCSIKRLALIYFPYAQQEHKLNGIGITELSGGCRLISYRQSILIM